MCYLFIIQKRIARLILGKQNIILLMGYLKNKIDI